MTGLISKLLQNWKRPLFNLSHYQRPLVIAVVTIWLGVGLASCLGQRNDLLALEITSPQNKAEVTEDLVTASGIVSPSSAVVTVNDHEVAIAEDGTFSSNIALNYGENTIVVNATVEGQEPVTKTLVVMRILSLEINSPQDKAEVAQSPITVRGSISDPAALVTVNGRQVETSSDGSFSSSVELNYVKNNITVTATVNGQPPVVKTLTVNRILVLELNSPDYIVETAGGLITVSGTVYPPSAVVTVNGKEVATTKDGRFSTTVELGYGENTIVVNATDPVTRTVVVTRTLTLEVDSPQDNSEVTESSIIVSGFVSDPATVVTVNGQPAEVAEDGTFSASAELEYGENTITVVTTVDGREIETRTIHVTRILTVMITSPHNQAEVAENPIAVSGFVSDPTALVTVDGQEAEVTDDGTFSASTELKSGENIIVVTATVEGQEPVTKALTVNYTPAE
jgi:flagellar hook assembly protein FlgD